VNETDNLDEKIDPDSLIQVVDADSSQTAALLEVKAGRNLVIQGPPGTGKSQTITNLMAQAIAEGKKVLFVSEKMAALEVVKRRLDELGLGAPCLELHSHKTNKKAVLDELKRTLEGVQPRCADRQRHTAELKQVRDRLNQYSRALHEPIHESGVTPYQAFGRLLTAQNNLQYLLEKKVKLPSLEGIRPCQWTRDEYNERRNLTEELQDLISRIGIPEKHSFWGSRKTIYLPADRLRLEETSRVARQHLAALTRVAKQLAGLFGAGAPDNPSDLHKWIAGARHILKAPDLSGVAINQAEWKTRREQIHRACSAGRRVRELHTCYRSRLQPSAWDADIDEAICTLVEYEPVWWKLLAKRYRKARRRILSLCLPNSPRSRRDLLEVGNAILETQRLNRELEGVEDLMRRLLGSRCDRWESHWRVIKRVVSYLVATWQVVDSGKLPSEVLRVLQCKERHPELSQTLEAVKSARDAYREAARSVLAVLELDEAARFGEGGFFSLAFDRQDKFLLTWEQNAARLQEMVTWNHLAHRMFELGLEAVIRVASKWEHGGQHLVDLLDKTRYDRLIEQAMRERPALPAFDGRTHDHNVDRFRDLDRRLLAITRSYVRQKHLASLPEVSGIGQAAILQREFHKKRRHRPIRQLMIDAGQAIQAIKPIFMMSPLSVAAYLPPGSVQFDLVVFDEASQVRPADAFGAVLRGKQAVVVGDSRQLPPTRFFDKIGALEKEQEGEWDTATSDMESILDLFSAQRAPQVMLRWHYRSHHHSLIAVSNHEFYDDKLVVFPAPGFSTFEDDRHELGLIFHHWPDTAYERGKAVNQLEADRVAEAVMEHARKYADLTLGVASFSVAQMRAIQDRLEILRRSDPSCEGFFADHPAEPFFVKNLENVQGDERDVVFISVGYGRTREGYLSMNFGPLNQDGGERRLNVLITRARRRCEVFSNIRADDIDLNRTSARGVAALKAFLRYAEQRILDVPSAQNGEPESPFENEVARALRQYGFDVHCQVGSAGFRLDLGVVDSVHPGRYLLGIECDGATYHSARWARDRDRLRQEVLERLGWRIHRIWSTDWFHDPDRELRRLLTSIERAKSGPPAGAPPRVPVEPNPGGEPPGSASTGSEFPGQPSPPSQDDPVIPYRRATLSIDLEGRELHEISKKRMAHWVEEVVREESPVHIVEVASRIAAAGGVKRTGQRIRFAVRTAARFAVARHRLERRGDFLWKRGMVTPPVRDRSLLSSTSRQIERVAPEEIVEAVTLLLRKSIAAKPEEAVTEACRLLGYPRVTDSIRQYAEKAIRAAILRGRFKLQNGSLVLP